MLLQRYENSATYKGQNRVNQSFTCKPDEVFPEYFADTASVEDVERFESEMLELEQKAMVTVQYRQGEISKVILRVDQIELCRQFLGVEDKAAYYARLKNILMQYRCRSELLCQMCDEQIERLNHYQKQNLISPDSLMDDLLRCIEAITENTEEYMEREFSIRYFGDSKYFEKHLKNAVCKQLLRFSEFGPEIRDYYDERHRSDPILACYQIEQNPSYIYMKGKGHIILIDQTCIPLSESFPFAVSSVAVKQIQQIKIDSDTVMTVENLTSYHRLPCNGCFVIFLSGYHNRLKTAFLQSVARDNNVKSWRHFGDIDPDGFQILQTLRVKTGLPFEPEYMTVDELKRFPDAWKELTAHDRQVAERLIQSGHHADVLQFCLEKSCKLEQECISWTLFQKRHS